MTAYKNAWNLITQADSIILLTHFKPDGDGMSACAALDKILCGMGKTVQTVYPSLSTQDIKRQAHDIKINTHTLTPDLLISCDTANYDRLYYPDAFKNIPLINIDHHVSNSIQGTINLNNPAAASTCEELFFFLQEVCPNNIDLFVAESLMVGILYDTQSFITSNTTARTLAAAAALSTLGADVSQLNQELMHRLSPAALHFWGILFTSCLFDESKNIAWVVVTKELLKKHTVSIESIEGFVNFLAKMARHDIALLAYETDDGFTKLSFRSKTYDVNQLAGQWGGGGHKKAAGALIKDTPVNAIKLVFDAL